MTIRTALSSALSVIAGRTSPSSHIATKGVPVHRRGFLTSSALALAFFSTPGIVRAEESTPITAKAEETSELKQKVVEFSSQALNELKPALLSNNHNEIVKLPNASMHWNNLGIAFNVTDNTGVDIDEHRRLILKAGLTNPNIPKWILHEAIYTAGKRAEYLNSQPQTKEHIDRETLAIVLEYFNKNIVPNDVIGFSVAQLCDQDSLNSISDIFISNRSSNRDKYFDIFAYVNQNRRVRLAEKTNLEIIKDLEQILSGKENLLFANNSNGEPELNLTENKERVSQLEKMYFAKGLLSLIRNDIDAKKCSLYISNYFKNKSPKSTSSDADYTVIRALAELSIKHPQEQSLVDILKEVSTTHSETFFNSYFCANATPLNSIQSEAGKAIARLFNSNQTLADVILLNALSAPKSKSQAIQAIASLNCLSSKPGFINILRTTVTNTEESPQARVASMRGLGRIKDEKSFEALLDIATNESNPAFLRGEALYTTLLVDAPEFIPKEFERLANESRPYGLELFFFGLNVDADVKYIPWECNPNIFSTSSTPTAENVSYFLDRLDQKYGGSTGKLANFLNSSDKWKKYIASIADYLRSKHSDIATSGSVLDFDIAIPAIYFLGHTGTNSDLLASIAKTPWDYVCDSNPKQVFTEAREDNANEFLLKFASIQALGGAVDINNSHDEGAKLLFRLITKETHPSLYQEAVSSELQISERIKKSPSASARNVHVKNLLNFLEKDILTPSTEPIIDLKSIERRRYFACKSLVNMSAEKELIELAFKHNWVKKGDEIFRIIAYALKSNDFKISDLANLNLSDTQQALFKDLYDCIASDRCFVGDAIEENNLTGDGIEIAIIDGGFPMFFEGEIKTPYNIIYPKEYFGPSTYDLKSKHARTVTHQVLEKLPKVTIHPLTWDRITASQDSLLSNDRFDPATQGFIELLKGKITGKNNIQVINMSFGVKSPGMSNNQKHKDYVNRRAAAGHLAVDLGIGCNVSVGNDRSADPVTSRNMELGGVNALLAYVGHGKRFTQPGGVSRVASYDNFRNRFVETSGSQDPLNSSSITLIGVNGYTNVCHQRIRGKETTIMYSATSFAVPNKGVIDIMSIELLKRKRIKFDPIKHNRLIEQTATTDENRDPHEGNKVFSLINFLSALKNQ